MLNKHQKMDKRNFILEKFLFNRDEHDFFDLTTDSIIFQISHVSLLLHFNTVTDEYAFDTVGTSSSMSTSTNAIITSMLPTLSQSCNITTCRSIIDDYLSRNWYYNTVNFGECQGGCLQAVYPNFPSDWWNRWYIQDMYILNSAGQDCVGNPYTGSLTSCQQSCLVDATCMGFARQKNVTDTDSTGQCWLKNNILLNQIPNDPVWHTVVFNTTSQKVYGNKPN